MPIFASESATSVQRRSPWHLTLPVYAAIFLAVAAAAFAWRCFGAAPRVDAPTAAVAKICIHRPNFAFQEAWQEVLGQARSDVRENLQIDAQRAGEQTVVAISFSGLTTETIVPMVNVVAAAYSQACRDHWKLHVEHAYSAAQENAREAEHQATEAQTRFELLRDRRLRAIAAARPVVPQRTTFENPRWTEAARRLADLETLEKKLLMERTPLHPAVQEIEERISEMRRDMASIPPQLTQETPAAMSQSVLPPDVPPAEEVQAAAQAAERLGQGLQQAQALERAALTTRGDELQIDLIAAEPLPVPPPRPHATAANFGTALVTATTSIVGLGMISMGASLEPAIFSIAELQALVPAAIVGVVPATHPGRRRTASSALRRRLARWAWMIAGLTVLIAVACLMVRG